MGKKSKAFFRAINEFKYKLDNLCYRNKKSSKLIRKILWAIVMGVESEGSLSRFFRAKMTSLKILYLLLALANISVSVLLIRGVIVSKQVRKRVYLVPLVYNPIIYYFLRIMWHTYNDSKDAMPFPCYFPYVCYLIWRQYAVFKDPAMAKKYIRWRELIDKKNPEVTKTQRIKLPTEVKTIAIDSINRPMKKPIPDVRLNLTKSEKVYEWAYENSLDIINWPELLKQVGCASKNMFESKKPEKLSQLISQLGKPTYYVKVDQAGNLIKDLNDPFMQYIKSKLNIVENPMLMFEGFQQGVQENFQQVLVPEFVKLGQRVDQVAIQSAPKALEAVSKNSPEAIEAATKTTTKVLRLRLKGGNELPKVLKAAPKLWGLK